MCCLRSRLSKQLVLLFSFLTACAGLATIGFSWFILTNQGLAMMPEIDAYVKAISIICGIAGVTAVLYGLLGFATTKIQQTACIASYGILSLIVLVYFIIVTIVLWQATNIKQQAIADICNGFMPDSVPSYLVSTINKLNVRINEMDTSIAKAVNSNMCK
jgi:hypothetical protein